jgi:molybdopterin converting factor small subunit
MDDVTLRVPKNIIKSPSVSSAAASGEVRFKVPAGQSTLQAIEGLGLQLSQPVIAVINAEARDISDLLEPGDEVRLLPQISGGSLNVHRSL